MTRTDVMASSRPQALGAGSNRGGSLRSRRALMALPLALLLAASLAMPTTAVAASEAAKEGLSGYGKTESKSGTSPSKETKAPASKETAPESKSVAPSSEPAKASSLPFTGFDLRWVIGAGLVLMIAGGSIVVMQRRDRSVRRR